MVVESYLIYLISFQKYILIKFKYFQQGLCLSACFYHSNYINLFVYFFLSEPQSLTFPIGAAVPKYRHLEKACKLSERDLLVAIDIIFKDFYVRFGSC